ncbi:ornithine decarboxylase-like [Anopheles nili]|uniref:ornithine decarboxylase-like n=1 Tax=Anopheles nili TaxID=185578 RepID=UPI00237B8925|nr:ornithine decarboxylase-like [Anopheles nili]
MALSSEQPCFVPTSAEDVVQRIVTSRATETSINILDLDEIVHSFERWKKNYSGMVPFYYPSVNNHPGVLTLMNKLGVGFCCASIMELRTAITLGVPTHQIRLVHPVKSPDTILYAKQENIQRITCDTIQDIAKVCRLHPTAEITLRIRVHPSQKFGCCSVVDVPEILSFVKSDGVNNIVGIHIALPQERPITNSTLQRALYVAKSTMVQATKLGLRDIRELVLSGTEIASPTQLLNALTLENFDSNCIFLVETERDLVESAVTLVTAVQSKRVIRESGLSGSIHEIMYFLNDGRYGSFEWWNVLEKQPTIYRNDKKMPSETTYASSLWGPTCDSADIVCEQLDLPELGIGDFLVFPRMGAYGATLASRFNGFPIPEIILCGQLDVSRTVMKDVLS